MTEVKSYEQLALVLRFLLPGLVILFVRAQFLTGRVQKGSDAVIFYFAISVLWWAFILTFVDVLGADKYAPSEKPITWLFLAFIGPAGFGALLGQGAREGWLRNVLAKVGIHLIHTMEASWDWTFAGKPGRFVIITLKDGATVHGFLGTNSFISSNPQERDLYIEQIYKLGDNEEWVLLPDTGLYISHGEVCRIELINDRPGEQNG